MTHQFIKISTVFISLIFSCISFSQAYEGMAFLDSNENGVRDPGENGLKDILVSDGLHVVKTDANGKYSLEGFDQFHFIMAHVPANYKTKKYYHPLKKGVKTYDFAFRPKQKRDDFKFVHISDTETYEFRDWLNVLKDYVLYEDPAFIMLTGDICYKRGMDFHSKHINDETFGIPVKYSVGNHDLVDGDYGEQFYEQHFGPVYYSFEEGNVLFISTPMRGGDYDPLYTKAQVRDYLENLLAHFPKGQPKMVYNHDLLTEGEEFLFGTEGKNINLNDYNLKAWVYGHFHNNNIKVHGDSGIKSICTASPVMGGIDHSPSMFRVIDVDTEGNTSTELRYTAINKHIRVVTPKQGQICKLIDGFLPISVNTYHSSSKVNSVRYSIVPSDFYPSWHDLSESEGWRPMEPQTDFNWTANWKPDTDAEGKKYSLRAQAFLNNGQVIRTKTDFTYHANADPIEIGGNWVTVSANAGHSGDPTRVVGPPLQMQWVSNAGANIFMGVPIVANGKVFVAAMDDNNYENGAIVAFDLYTGKKLWRYPTTGSIKNSMAYSMGNIVATDSRGLTYAINGDTGKLSWKTDLNADRMPPYVSGIVASGNMIYTGYGNRLSALDAKTGKLIWRNKDWSGGEGSVPTLTLAGDILVASGQWKALYAHDTKTGKLKWKRRDNDMSTRDATTTFKDGSLYAPSGPSLVVLDPKTGKTKKERKTDFGFNVSAAPIITDTYIVTATRGKGLVAFDKETLKVVWNYDLDPALIYTSPYSKTNEHTVEATPVLSGNTIYCGGSDGYFYAIDLHSGKELWKIDLGAPIFSSVAISGNMVLVCDFSGNVHAFAPNVPN